MEEGLVKGIDVSDFYSKKDYPGLELYVGVYKDTDETQMLVLTVTDKRYSLPKDYQISFNASLILAMEEKYYKWLLGVIGRQFLEAVVDSADNTRKAIGENYRAFLASMGIF